MENVKREIKIYRQGVQMPPRNKKEALVIDIKDALGIIQNVSANTKGLEAVGRKISEALDEIYNNEIHTKVKTNDSNN